MSPSGHCTWLELFPHFCLSLYVCARVDSELNYMYEHVCFGVVATCRHVRVLDPEAKTL